MHPLKRMHSDALVHTALGFDAGLQAVGATDGAWAWASRPCTPRGRVQFCGIVGRQLCDGLYHSRGTTCDGGALHQSSCGWCRAAVTVGTRQQGRARQVVLPVVLNLRVGAWRSGGPAQRSFSTKGSGSAVPSGSTRTACRKPRRPWSRIDDRESTGPSGKMAGVDGVSGRIPALEGCRKCSAKIDLPCGRRSA
jgi:hypothetical protein